jgi:hypothetical protein
MVNENLQRQKDQHLSRLMGGEFSEFPIGFLVEHTQSNLRRGPKSKLFPFLKGPMKVMAIRPNLIRDEKRKRNSAFSCSFLVFGCLEIIERRNSDVPGVWCENDWRTLLVNFSRRAGSTGRLKFEMGSQLRLLADLLPKFSFDLSIWIALTFSDFHALRSQMYDFIH